jgi:hypothetical protein
MPEKPSVKSADLSLMSVPAFWPMAMAAGLIEQGAELYAKNLRFVDEEIKIHDDLRPKLATPNHARLDLRTMVLREYGKPGGIPTLIDAPYAGHTAMIADYHKGQSLVETLLANGIGHVALTDWKSATDDMKDLEIDNYLAEVIVAIDDLGGRVNLVGLGFEPARNEVKSIVAYVLETEFIGRASMEDAEVRYCANVNLLGARRHVADRHVFDHALPQRRHLFTHR